MTDTSKFRPEVSKLFEPGPPLRIVEHIDYDPSQRKTANIDGISGFISKLQEYKEEQANLPIKEPTKEELTSLNLIREKKAKQLRNKQKLDEDYANWNPNEDPHIKGDPYKTLLIARLDYDVTEIDIQQEFSKYGDIERVRIVRDKTTNKSKGYGFIVFERQSSVREAFKLANGLKLKNREIITDVERGRTSKSWLPRRLGGGIGGRGYTQRKKQMEKQQYNFKPSDATGANARFSGRGRGGGGSGGGRFGSSRGGFSSRGRGGHDSYESRRGGYPARSDRAPAGDLRGVEPRGGYYSRDRPERSERPERIERIDRTENKAFEYSSRSRRKDADFNDRQRDRDRDSRTQMQTERDKEREHYREKRIEQQRERMRY